MKPSVPTLFTLPQFAEKHPAFSIQSLRWIRFRAFPVERSFRDGKVEDVPPNGFAEAFVKVAGRVYVDEQRFFEIAEQGRANR